ncbi:MAG: urea carboxylase-associated family protein [Dongiaceae bacterium]
MTGSGREIVVPAGEGRCRRLARGATLSVVNTHGTQVVDTWAFAVAGDAGGIPGGVPEFMSMEHCREVLKRIVFEPGDILITNRYRPILTVLADTSPGGHDTLIAACSEAMYIQAGRPPGHRNCSDNLRDALAAEKVALPFTPSPWNLFMIAAVIDGHAIDYRRPVSRPGDCVTVRAEMDCLVVVSACPDDVYPTNGGDGTPRDVLLRLGG